MGNEARARLACHFDELPRRWAMLRAKAARTVQLTTEVPATGAAGFAGNILVGGLVGMGVDAVTGAATDHKPNPVIVTLQPIAPLRVPPRAARKPRPPAPSGAGT
jgi:hypothetical protein